MCTQGVFTNSSLLDNMAEKSPCSYWQRSYRNLFQADLIASRVRLAETDIHILAPVPVGDEALALAVQARIEIEQYIKHKPDFLNSLITLDIDEDSPPIVRRMLIASQAAGVGPMAAVAGAIAGFIGDNLLARGHLEVIVENGGDLFIHRTKECTVAVYAGESPLSGRVGIKLQVEQMSCGVCTSSASIGHSKSFGTADAAVVVAKSVSLADALATRLGNEVKDEPGSIEQALRVVKNTQGIIGALVIAGDKMGVCGELQLSEISV
jgi:hypothetical protein